jgi:hypothetical protein
MAIRFAGGTDEIRIPLTGSRRAITAAQQLCSQPHMPLKNSVPLTAYSSYLLLAKALRKSDIADFAMSTSSAPRLRAGMVEIGDGRRLLFTELCGSTWYYGSSGCNVTGFAPVEGEDPATPKGWREVYETEGVYLYTDPETSHDGWPDLLAYSMPQPGDPVRWVWKDDAYALVDQTAQAQGSDGSSVMEAPLRR